MKHIRVGRGLAVVLAALVLAACAGAEPFDYTPVSEIPPGPGLMSGDDGEFVIYGSLPAGPGSPPAEASLGGGAAATAEVPGGLTADYENASYADALFPLPGEEDSQQEAPAAN